MHLLVAFSNRQLLVKAGFQWKLCICLFEEKAFLHGCHRNLKLALTKYVSI